MKIHFSFILYKKGRGKIKKWVAWDVKRKTLTDEEIFKKMIKQEYDNEDIKVEFPEIEKIEP